MDDLAEGLHRSGADAQGGAVVADEMGEARLDLIVPRAQSIIGGVRDLGLVLAVIELVVMGDLGGEPGKLGGSLGLVKLADRLRPLSCLPSSSSLLIVSSR